MEIKKYGGSSSKGPYLNLNEDLCECDLSNKLFFVLDGFGGAGIGDRAVKLIKEQVKDFYLKSTEDQDATMPFYYNFHYTVELNALINSIVCSHRLLLKDNEGKDINSRAGASGAFVCQSLNTLNFLFIGNVHAYLLRGGKLISLYEADQSLSLMNEGEDSLSAKRIPYNAFGLYYHLDYKVKEVKIEEGDRIFLCSDGAVDRLNYAQIKELLSSEVSLDEIINSIYSKNNELNNKDNQSGIILNY